MNNKITGSLLAILTTLFAGMDIGFADEFPPSHMCFEPEQPLFLASQRHQQRYQEDSQRFDVCMKKFIADQYESIKMHEAAAKQAKTEWEKFFNQK